MEEIIYKIQVLEWFMFFNIFVYAIAGLFLLFKGLSSICDEPRAYNITLVQKDPVQKTNNVKKKKMGRPKKKTTTKEKVGK